MNKSFDISVIIATYKRETHLVNCIKSLLQNEMRSFEIIVVDDGGNLNRSIENLFEGKSIKWLYLSKNIGQPGAQAKGAEVAEGKILAFLDDDAIVEKNWIWSINNYFENYNNILSVVGLVLPIDDSHILSRMRQKVYDSRAEKYADPEFRKKLIDKYNLEVGTEVIISDHVSGGNFAIKRELYFCVSGFRTDIRRNNDHDFSRRILEAGYCIGYNSGMIIYHDHNKGYLVLFKNMISEGRNHVKMLAKKGKWANITSAIMNLLYVPFKIVKFKKILSADKNKLKVYFIYTTMQFFDGIGRIMQVFGFDKKC